VTWVESQVRAEQGMTGLGKHGQDARMIGTAVSRHWELASQRFLEENEHRRAKREDRRYGLLANTVAPNVTTILLAERILNPRSRKPFDLLLHGVGDRFQNVVHHDEYCNL